MTRKTKRQPRVAAKKAKQAPEIKNYADGEIQYASPGKITAVESVPKGNIERLCEETVSSLGVLESELSYLSNSLKEKLGSPEEKTECSEYPKAHSKIINDLSFINMRLKRVTEQITALYQLQKEQL